MAARVRSRNIRTAYTRAHTLILGESLESNSDLAVVIYHFFYSILFLHSSLSQEGPPIKEEPVIKSAFRNWSRSIR